MEIVAKQIDLHSKTNLNLSKEHRIKIDFTDNYFLFSLKFKQYKNANIPKFVQFEKTLLAVLDFQFLSLETIK